MSTANDSRASTTPLAQAHDLLVSLLRWWPFPPYQKSPSLLFAGPTANGKSHLVHRAVREANAATTIPAASVTSATSSSLCVIEVTPPLAPALAVHMAADGCTGIRRLLRRSVQEACKKAVSRMVSELAVLVVLDHVECYLRHNNASISGPDSAGTSDTARSTRSVDGGRHDNHLSTSYPSIVADLYTVLMAAPPLFSQKECAELHLSRLVFVSLFTGALDEVLMVVRQRYVDYALSLPTPSASERRVFFAERTVSSMENVSTQRFLLPALLDALTFRTGGVSYGGLQEVIDHARDEVVFSPYLKVGTSSSPPSGTLSVEWAGAVAQRVLQAYQSSGSVTALEYRRSAGYVDVQTTHWDDIAGMDAVKSTLQKLVTEPIRHLRSYRHYHVRPSTGVLLYGPPGTGKTMLARAMATELNASFVYMDLPELVQSEVGESERRLQEYFDVARRRSPSVVFMDEVQAAFGLRYGGDGACSTSGQTGGGAARVSTSHDARLISHLLRLLDAAQADEEHFVLFVGATNVVHLLDPLLLRAGRLDTLLEVPLPDVAARTSLVRRVIYGEWAGWFSGSDAVGGEEALRAALVEEFVRRSEDYSGAQLRHFTSVFALHLARIASQEVERKTMLEEGDPLSSEEENEGSRVRQQCLHAAIRDFLKREDSDPGLSARAMELMETAYRKSLV